MYQIILEDHRTIVPHSNSNIVLMLRHMTTVDTMIIVAMIIINKEVMFLPHSLIATVNMTRLTATAIVNMTHLMAIAIIHQCLLRHVIKTHQVAMAPVNNLIKL
jgi:hypothetical protein